MAKLVLDMSMSLDGFITGPNDGPEAGLGVGGHRLHAWLPDGDFDDPLTFRPDGPSGEVFDEMMATGAVLVGRRTFDIAGHWNGDHHDGVPIFVPTHHVPDDPPTGRATITYVADGIESAVAQAKAAAGERNVMMHGADAAQSCLRAGVLDEMEIHVVPVLLGEGRRLFEHLSAEHIELELTRTIDAPGVIHLHYVVRR
ncbi:MAG: dihydrofolate reductase family protein [Acidimicrobiia bacterium]